MLTKTPITLKQGPRTYTPPIYRWDRTSSKNRYTATFEFGEGTNPPTIIVDDPAFRVVQHVTNPTPIGYYHHRITIERVDGITAESLLAPLPTTSTVHHTDTPIVAYLPLPTYCKEVGNFLRDGALGEFEIFRSLNTSNPDNPLLDHEEAILAPNVETVLKRIRRLVPSPPGTTRVLFYSDIPSSNRSNGALVHAKYDDIVVFPFSILTTRDPEIAAELLRKHGSMPSLYFIDLESPYNCAPKPFYPGGFRHYRCSPRAAKASATRRNNIIRKLKREHNWLDPDAVTQSITILHRLDQIFDFHHTLRDATSQPPLTPHRNPNYFLELKPAQRSDPYRATVANLSTYFHRVFNPRRHHTTYLPRNISTSNYLLNPFYNNQTRYLRTLRQHFRPQLLTLLSLLPGPVWFHMPRHTDERRMALYLYNLVRLLDLPTYPAYTPPLPSD